jgi:hypothetical protein
VKECIGWLNVQSVRDEACALYGVDGNYYNAATGSAYIPLTGEHFGATSMSLWSVGQASGGAFCVMQCMHVCHVGSRVGASITSTNPLLHCRLPLLLLLLLCIFSQNSQGQACC